MALALNHHPRTRQNVRPARHLYLVPELDPTPVGAYRPASRPGTRPASRPAARRSAQHPSLATTAANTSSVATYQRRRLVVLVATMLILGVVIAGVIGATGTTAQADQAVAGQSIEPRTVMPVKSYAFRKSAVSLFFTREFGVMCQKCIVQVVRLTTPR